MIFELMSERSAISFKPGYALGLDLGGTVLKFGIVDHRGNTIFEDHLPSLGKHGCDKMRNQILKAVTRSREAASSNNASIRCIGFGTPGTVDAQGRVQGELPNLPHWRNFPVVEFLKEISDYIVVVENDANLMTFAEALTGSGMGFSTVFGITFGTGIGGGFVVNGELYTGTGGAGEIGHTTVVPQGRSCGCGRVGCMERYGSVTAIEETYFNVKGENRTAQDIVEHWLCQDRFATDVMEEFLEYSSLGIINMLQILRPECLVLGGGLLEIHEAVFNSLSRRLDEDVPEAVRDTVSVRKATHGNRAGLIGAGVYALAVSEQDSIEELRRNGRAYTRNG